LTIEAETNLLRLRFERVGPARVGERVQHGAEHFERFAAAHDPSARAEAGERIRRLLVPSERDRAYADDRPPAQATGKGRIGKQTSD